MRVLTEANCLEITGGLNLVYQDISNEDGGSNGYGMPGVFLLDRWGDGGGSSGNMGAAGNGTNVNCRESTEVFRTTTNTTTTTSAGLTISNIPPYITFSTGLPTTTTTRSAGVTTKIICE